MKHQTSIDTAAKQGNDIAHTTHPKEHQVLSPG